MFDEDTENEDSPLSMANEEDETEQEGALSQLSTQSMPAADEGYRLLMEQARKASEREQQLFEAELARIEAAKQRLLAKPEKLTGRERLDMILESLSRRPTDTSDPRFFERKNIGTFFRDIGEAGTAAKAEERKRAEERAAGLDELEQLKAKFLLPKAAQQAQQARQELMREEQRRARAAQPPRVGSSEFERLLSTIPEEERTPLVKSRIRMLTEGSLPKEVIDTLARDYEIIGNPEKYPPNIVAAAQSRIEKFKPADVRKDERAEAAKENLYRSRISRQARVVIPDIDRAIKILEENPNIAAGNFSNWIVDLPVFGQQAKDLDSLLQSVRSAVGFGQLEDLKLMSPTGASGLGAVSNFEQQLLQSVEGSLARDMSAPNLKMNLERLKNFYEVDLPMFIEAKGIDLSGIGGRPARSSDEGKKSPAEKAREEIEKREALKKGGG